MLIAAANLSYTYMPGTPYATEALRDITFGLGEGSFALLIGSSGSGKTTLIQHLNGLLKPTAGEVYYNGLKVGTDRAALLGLRRRIGMVFQMPEDHFFSETVFDEVAFAPRSLGFAENAVETRVKEALERVGLGGKDLRARHPFQLSAGQKRLVAFAAVLSSEPEALILDEPAAGLDSAGRQNLFNLLSRLNREERLTVLVSTHHLDEIVALADRVLVLDHGRLILSGPVDAVFARRKELNDLGLALPEITELMLALSAGGLPVATAIYSLAAARAELNKLKRQDNR